MRQIAEAHGGEVEVESAAGSRAVFTVNLRREPPGGEEAARLDRRRSR